MRKKNTKRQPRKLSINRETIRTIDDVALGGVGGGCNTTSWTTEVKTSPVTQTCLGCP